MGMVAAQVLSDATAFHDVYEEYRFSYDRALYNAFVYGPSKSVIDST
jgi:hypothetical protein